MQLFIRGIYSVSHQKYNSIEIKVVNYDCEFF